MTAETTERLVQVTARRLATWIVSFKLRVELSRLTCTELLDRAWLVPDDGVAP